MLKKYLSFLLVFVMAMNMLSYASVSTTQELPETSMSVSIKDISGEDYVISQTETSTIRSTYLYDSDGKLLETFILNKTSGSMTNPKNGKTIKVPEMLGRKMETCDVMRAGKDYEYEFCSLGESYTESSSLTVGEICGMISAGVSAVTITAAICAIAGVVSWTGAAKGAVSTLAKEILNLWTKGISDRTIDMTFKFVCREMWETDSSYPNGGFYFLAYGVDSSYFSYSM